MAHVLGYNGIIYALRRLHRLLPSCGAQAPFAAGLKTDAAEVIAPGRAEVEELFGEDTWWRLVIEFDLKAGDGSLAR